MIRETSAKALLECVVLGAGAVRMLQQMELRDGRLNGLGAASGNVFVYINPTEAERKHLIEDLKLDEHTLNSAMDPDELARLEFEPEHVAIIYKRPKNYSSEDKFLFKVVSAGLFLFADKLIVVTGDDIPVFQGRPFLKVASLADLALRLVYRSIFHFLEHLRGINAISDELEDQISQSMENKYLLNLFTLEKSLVYYLNAINSNGKLIERLKLSSGKLGLGTESLEFLDDMLIENAQCYEQAEIYSNILSSMMDARASIVSNNLNWLMKTLNIITIGIMVPTLVTSVFSMNVDFPGRTHPAMFWVILVLAAISVIQVAVVWRWKRW